MQDGVTLSTFIPGFHLLLSNVQQACSKSSPYHHARLSLESEKSQVGMAEIEYRMES